MIHTFKIGTKKIIFDKNERAVAALDTLEGEIFDRIIGEEVPSETPSMELRYALAKYDSSALAVAYKRVYALISGDEGYKAVKLSDVAGEYTLTAAEYEKLAREIYKSARLGLPCDDAIFSVSKEDIDGFDCADQDERHRIECALFLQAAL
jgi:hypothetical protein